jgi:ACR3 family arsenite transporter
MISRRPSVLAATAIMAATLNGRQQVIDMRGQPIPGLYAGGEAIPDVEMCRLFAIDADRYELDNGEPLPAIFRKATAPIVLIGVDSASWLKTAAWGFVMPQVSKKTGKPIQPKVVNNAQRRRVVPCAKDKGRPMSLFERWLTLWVALCILAGLVLGNLLPGAFGVLASLEYASVNLVVAVLIWAMVYPMMIAIDFGSLKAVGQRPKGLIITLVINWLIKPFTMAALAVLFFNHVFAGLIDPERAPEYIAGLILLGAAPCTAMVFVWSQLTRGDPNYTLVQVSVNDLIMVVAFAPIVAFLLGVTDISVPWETLVLSVVLYIVIPLIAGALTRRALIARGGVRAVDAFTAWIKPASVLGLLLTVVLLFGFQGQLILAQPLLIALIAVPIVIQSYGIFALGYGAAWVWRVPHKVAAPCALIGTSNFFELAVAVAIGLFGLDSGAALATVVGVLVEVPVMLSLVAFANRTRARFHRGRR